MATTRPTRIPPEERDVHRACFYAIRTIGKYRLTSQRQRQGGSGRRAQKHPLKLIYTDVEAALERTLRTAVLKEKQDGQWVFDLQRDKYIIFSDHHKGGRDGADDFLACERAYHAALAYYFRMGFTLVLLGDVEELWEETPGTVLDRYAYTYRLESRFQKTGRYLRFWGNHDDDWSYPDLVRRYLDPALTHGSGLRVRESLVVRVQDAGKEIGSFLLLHGHQGTLINDSLRPLSRLFVRWIWRPVQRLLRIPINTPAKDWQLRHAHDAEMYRWSERKRRLVLIAGHTHRPVFKSLTHAAQTRLELERVEKARAENPQDPELQVQAARLSAELEWIRAQNREVSGSAGEVVFRKPSYFNSGCCAFADGDITGLEIADGEIRLVRWPNNAGQPLPQYFPDARADVRAVFAACS